MIEETNRSYSEKDILNILEENKKLKNENRDLTNKLMLQDFSLRNENSILSNLFTNAPAGICILEGPNHVYKFVNPVYQKLAGNRELIGKTIREAFPESEGQGLFETFDMVYQTGEVFIGNELPVKFMHEGDGVITENYFNFVYQPIVDSLGQVIGINTFCFDVTPQVMARKQTEKLNQELKESEGQNEFLRNSLKETVKQRTEELLKANKQIETQKNNLENIFMNAPAVISVLKGSDLVFELVNPNYQKLFGNRSLLGKPIRIAQPDLEGQGFYEVLENVYSSGNPYFGYAVPAKIENEGSLVETYFNFIYQPIFSSEDKVEGIIIFAYDVTKQILAQQETENLNKELKKSEIKYKNLSESLELIVKERTSELLNTNHELERFNYIASHDLQSPLRTIISYSNLLQKRYEGKFDSDADEFLDSIIQAGNIMKSLIDDLLNFSKIGKQDIQYREVNLNKIITDIIKSNKVFIDENNAVIKYEQLPTVNAEHSHMYQIFQNLISNAIKYRKPDIAPVIEISVLQKNAQWVFTIKDNGIGIDSVYFKQIFELFKRLHSISTHPGSGIGLSTVKKLVELYKGKVWIKSELGEGTTFFFTFPCFK